MSRIPENIIEEIQMRSDIVEVINHYIPLKRLGANFKALCPFHHEQTPSFVVSQSKQIYHCFGCGAGGNVFGFLMQHEHLEFVDAVKILAERAGINIPETNRSLKQESSRGLGEANKFAGKIFCKWLQGSNAYKYLKSRGFKDDIIEKYQLGYSPGRNRFVNEARKAGFRDDLLLKAGLATRGSGGLQDMFRDRLMFPIFSVIGKIVGFSGRVLNDGLPKYINTPENPLFHKGKILYGLHISKGEIVKRGYAIICEGYFDFLRSYQEGVKEIVASQGTAFTRDHVHLLRRYTSDIVVAFDSDAAGNKAALSGLDVFIQEGVRVHVVTLPSGEDPDSFIKKNGAAAFQKLIGQARDILEAKVISLCERYPVGTTKGKLQILNQLLPDIAKIQNDVWKRQFVKYIAAKLSIPEESLWLEIKKTRKAKLTFKTTEQSLEKVFAGDEHFPGERALLHLLLNEESLPQWVFNEFDPEEFQHSKYRQILELVIDLKKVGRWKGVQSVMAILQNGELEKIVYKIAVQEHNYEDREKAIRDCLYDIKRRHRESKIKKLILELENAEKQNKDVIGAINKIKTVKAELLEMKKNKGKISIS